MAVLALRINGPNVGDFEYRINISDADAGRILRGYGRLYGTIQENDNQGNIVVRPHTPLEIVTKIAQGFQEGVFENVQRWEKEEEAERARNAVPPITPQATVPVVNGVDPEGNVVNDIAAKLQEQEQSGYFTKLWSAIKGA